MISREEVLGLAQLARLKLSEVEVAGLQKDISSILGYVEQISSVSIQGETLKPEISKVPPLAPCNVMREDAPHGEGSMLLGKREALLAALPRREGDFAVVRKIIQKDE